jgi:hypothetical protein
MNPPWACLNFFNCYDVPGSHANHGPHIHNCSSCTRDRNLPGRYDAVVTALLILRYKLFALDYTDFRRGRPQRGTVFSKNFRFLQSGKLAAWPSRTVLSFFNPSLALIT